MRLIYHLKNYIFSINKSSCIKAEDFHQFFAVKRIRKPMGLNVFFIINNPNANPAALQYTNQGLNMDLEKNGR